MTRLGVEAPRQETVPLSDLVTEIDDGEGGLEIFVEAAEEEPEQKIEKAVSSDGLENGHPKQQLPKAFELKESVISYIENWMKSQQIDQKVGVTV